jgi:hypothetical protein
MVHTEEENPERHEHVWGEVRGHLRPGNNNKPVLSLANWC